MDDMFSPSSISAVLWPGILYMPDPDLDTYINPLHLWLMFDGDHLRQDTQKKIKAMRSIGFRQSIEHRPCGYFQFFSLPACLGLWCSLQRGHVPFPGNQCVCSFRDHSSIGFSCRICIGVKFPLLRAQSKATMLLISNTHAFT